MANFSLGDEVELIDSKEKGIIIKIQNDKLTVDIDGFEYETSVNEIILTKNSPSKNLPITEKPTEIQEGIYILLDTEEHWVVLYLLNYTASYLHFIANAVKNKSIEYVKDGIIEPFKSQKLKTVSSDLISVEGKIQLQLMSCYKNSPEKNQILTFTFEPTQKTLNRKLQFIKNLQKEVIVYPLQIEENHSKEPKKISLHLKEKKENKKVDLHLELEIEKVYDLHIEKLTNQPHLIEEHKRLDFQLKKAEEFLYEALQQKCSKIIFIHGGGKGKLKEKLMDLFKNHPYIEEFGTADIQKYGLGATYFNLKVK